MSNISILNDSGKPTICIDGKNIAPVLYSLSDFPGARSNTAYAQKNISQFAAAGVNLISVDTALHRGWKRISPFDPESLITEISYVLDANPNAKVLVRLHMNPPYWWLRDNKEECVVYRTEDGDKFGVDDGEYDRLIQNDGDNPKHIRVSLASKKWINDACDKLILFLNALKDTREGNAVMAIQVACGIYGEWHQWGTDVSRPMKERFKAYLKEKYCSEEKLRIAWNNPSVTFDTANFRPETFRPGDDGCFRDPKKSMDTIDSQQCVQLTVSEAILIFARKVKECMPNVLCGCFYGYYLGCGGDYMTIFGHLNVDKLYKAQGLIDFMCGPFAYEDNRKSTGVPMQRGLLESSRLRGMLWLTEMDQHPVGTEQYIGGDPDKFDETVSVLYRETLKPLLSGMGFWYYDHRIIPQLIAPDSKNASAGSIYRKNGWWDTPELMQEISKIQSFAKRLTTMPYKSNADVLLVYDTDSYYYRSNVIDAGYDLHEVLGRLGTVFDCIYKKELEVCNISSYKCVIFVNCNMVTKDERNRIQELTKGKMTIYLCGYGYCDGISLSESNISNATGMNIEKISNVKCIKICDGEEKIEIPDDLAPLFKVTDTAAIPLAYYENGTVAAAKKGDSVFISLHTIPRVFAHKLLSYANVRFWCDSNEPVIAGFDYVALNCQKSGKRTLYFPNGRKTEIITDGFATLVYDVNTGERVF